MKIKITILALLACLICVSLQAASVTPDRALEIAQKIFAPQSATKAGTGTLRIVWDGEFTDSPATKSSSQPAFYVIARDGGGFVIIAGDDNATPVLGISERNGFKVEGMPDNVRWWMEKMKAYVRSMSSLKGPAHVKWAAYAATKGDSLPESLVTDKMEKLTPEWDQGGSDSYWYGRSIFNKFCPFDTNENELSLTGCVATAVAEVLTWQSGQAGITMPVKGKGTVGGYYTPQGRFAPDSYELTTVYDWEGLRTLTDDPAIFQAIDDGKNDLLDNLGHLLADLGAMVKASYSATATSAITELVPQYLAPYLGMNKGAYYAKAAAYSPRAWVEKLKAELDLRPLIFSGRNSNNGGHAFVFDGYGKFDGNDVFHVNFGWGGYNNGYYYHNDADRYVFECAAIFDFYPAPDSEYPVVLEAVYHNGTDIPGVALQKMEYGFLVFYAIRNEGNTDYNGRVKFVVRHKNGGEDSINNSEQPFSMPSGYSGWKSFGYVDIPDIAFGDEVVCYYYDNGWKLLTCGNPASAISAWPLMPAAFIEVENSYTRGDYFIFKLKNNDTRYLGTIWKITDPDGNVVSLPQSEWEFKLTKAGTYRIEAAVAPTDGAAVTETIVTSIKVN